MKNVLHRGIQKSCQTHGQTQRGVVFVVFDGVNGLTGDSQGLGQVLLGAVSYTHLDVYKRQAAYGASGVGRSMASGAFGSGTGGNCRRRAAVSGIFTACWEKMKRKMNLPLDRMRFPCYPN